MAAKIIKGSGGALDLTGGASHQAADPQLKRGQSESKVLTPPYDSEKIAELVNKSSILPQCIAAMVAGCEREYILDPRNDDGSGDKAEWDNLDQFFTFIDPEGRDSFRRIREKTRIDYETFGYAAWEMVRNAVGDLIGIRHVQINTLRLTPIGATLVETTVRRLVGGEIKEEKVFRRFRRYMQEVAGQKIWFKEWGDPRGMDYTSGEFTENVAPGEAATEILWFGQYNPSSPYGSPRWVGTSFEVAGVRAASECNYSYFDGNAIPAAAIMVSGGTLGEDAVDTIREFIEGNVQKRGGANSVLILEAVPQGVDASVGFDGKMPQTKIEIKSLRDVQQNDAQFLNYTKECKTAIRSTFRLPPLLVGLSEDYTLATAKESIQQAEDTVFAPERQAFDFVMNRILVQEFSIKTWLFKTKSIDVSDPTELGNLLRLGSDTAALTPNEIRQVLQKPAGLDLKPLPDDIGDTPIASRSSGGGVFDGLLDDDTAGITKSERLMKGLWKFREELRKNDKSKQK